jgi:hypothetical protein
MKREEGTGEGRAIVSYINLSTTNLINSCLIHDKKATKQQTAMPNLKHYLKKKGPG